MWFYLVMIALCLVPGEGNNTKTCYSPVVCSDGELTRRDWLQVDLTPQNQNYNNVNRQSNEFATLGSGQQQDETLIKTLFKEETEDLLSEFKQLTGSLSSENAKQETNIENLNTTMDKMTSDLGNLKEIFEEKIENSSIKNAKEVSDLRSQLEALNDSVVNENAEVARKFENLSATIKKDVGEVSSQLNILSEAQNQENLKQQNELLKLKESLEKQTDDLQTNLKQLSNSAAIENAKLQTKIEANFEKLKEIMEKNVGEVSSQLNILSEAQNQENLKQQNELLKLKESLEKQTDDLKADLKQLSKSAAIENAKLQTKIKAIFEKLKEIMEKKFQASEKAFDAKMTDIIFALVSKRKTSIVTNFLKEKGLCDIQYSNSCFWAIVRNTYDVNYADAERLCKKSGGQVADIYNKQLYDVILKYLRTKMPSSSTWIYIWIATKYNPVTRVATARNGGQAFVSWRPGRQYSGSSYSSWTAVWIEVIRQGSRNNQWMSNRYPAASINGAVCEI